MTDITEKHTQISDRPQNTESKTITTEIVDGKTINMKYNRYIDKYEQLPTEPIRSFYANGKPNFEKLPDGTVRTWHKNGQLKSEDLPDGTERWWYENGQIRSEYLPEIAERGWYPSGALAYEDFPDSTKRSWHSNGQLKCEKSNGTVTEYNSYGKIIRHSTNGKDDTKSYLKAKERREALRQIISKKIDKRESKRPNTETKKYKRVIKNKTLTKLLASVKATITKEN